MRLICISLLCLAFVPLTTAAASPPAVDMRGYYMTFMRMPAMDLEAWKSTLDSISEDGANTLILWMAGAFPSKKFPITWAYNKDHRNAQNNFGRELIDYAHQKKMRVLLGFTPFGYDGVNQFPIEHPELKAKKADGQPVDFFGIHCWGWSLCPAKIESQNFLIEYIREMLFDFHPNADGLLVESSDYNICRCPDCGVKYYDREFGFVENISREVWERNPAATILVYPHYFTGKKVNAGTGIEAEAAKNTFDPRWHLFFTPHSAQIDLDLLQKGATGVFWNDSLSLGTPASIRHGAQTARKHRLGFIPSLEPFSYIPTRDEFGATRGRRIRPLGFEWLDDISRPLTVLPARVQRFGFREFSREPGLIDADFHRRLGEHFFPGGETGQKIEDLLFLQECVNLNRDWSSASPLVNPELYKLKSAREKWSADRQADYRARVKRLAHLAERYKDSTGGAEQEMHNIARFISSRWSTYHD